MTGGIVAGATPLRALVVEDSITIRKYLAGVLRVHGIEVVGEAADGASAVEMCRALRPDVVTMDMILPGLSGLAATEQIMAFSPTPILIVSASVNRGEVFQTYDALAAGGGGCVRQGARGGAAGRRRGFERERAAGLGAALCGGGADGRADQGDYASESAAGAGACVCAKGGWTGGGFGKSGRCGSCGERAWCAGKWDAYGCDRAGASTGGPAALVEILRGLPANFPVPILIVLHISELFSFAFADWLNTLSPIPARYARDGELLEPPGRPQAILAPAGRHLTLEGRVLRLRDTAERHSCKPSIDVLFESLAAQPSCRSLLCLLTGMGKDGAAGLLAARRAGLRTVAQDEASSVIFGMPGEAVRLGAAGQVLPLDAIAPFLIAASGSGSGQAGAQGDARPSGERAAS